MTAPKRALVTLVLILVGGTLARAHSGPPFPIASDRVAGPYRISIWTDPDTTDDGRAAGQFWVELAAADGKTTVPAGTQATVSIRPLDREGASHEGGAEPVNGAVTRQFIALLMDHEGPFGVHVAIDGPLGRAAIDAQVNATYDARPARWLIAVYLIPFVALGLFWMKAMRRRRTAGPRRSR
jgi:hypothetical protein